MNSYKFFTNKECKYYPCHKDINELNCLFCYCPLHAYEHCPGTPTYIELDGKKVKDCSNCTFPHQAENYDIIIRLLGECKHD